MATTQPDVGQASSPGPIGVYVHIPFCRAKCAYCDFHSYAGLEGLRGRYLAALVREAARAAPRWRDPGADTLFVGGGTPTTLPPDDLARLLRACRRHFGVWPHAEVSLEANPGTVSSPDLQALRRAGYNRLSLGVQSLRDDELALLGRIHSAGEALCAYRWAREAGFGNVNLDLIYGLPRQSLRQWRESLERALDLSPEHLSLYALSVEDGTPLAACLARGALPPPDDAAAADMYELAHDLLERAGYAHYEISNWARMGPRQAAPAGRTKALPEDESSDGMPALACRHNVKYWRNLVYLGLGSAAHSYDGRCRRGNLTSPAEYIAGVEAGRDPVAEAEGLDPDRRMDETMMLGLRLIEGVTREGFARRFGVALDDVYAAEVTRLTAEGLLAADERGIRLTPRGRLLGNRVFAAFLREEKAH